MRYVHIKQGFGHGRVLQDIDFPLVADFKTGTRGLYITVNGENLQGFPQRNFKVFIENRNDVEFFDHEDLLNNSAVTAADDSSSDPSEFGLETQGILLRGHIKPSSLFYRAEVPQKTIAEQPIEAIRESMIERFSVLSEMSIAAATGSIRGLVVYGPPGVGKSFEVEQAMRLAGAISGEEFYQIKSERYPKVAEEVDIDDLDNIDQEREINPETMEPSSAYKELFEIDPETGQEIIKKQVFHIHKGHIKASGLYTYLYERRHAHNVLIFDDTNTVLSDEDCVEVLKAALDTTTRRTLSWSVSRRLDSTPLHFEFEASIIFISNTNFQQLAMSTSKISQHIEAILDRCLYIDLLLDTQREKLVRIDYVSRDLKMIDRRLTSGADSVDEDAVETMREEILDWVHQNYDKFNNVSLRKILHLADLRKSSSNWKRIAEVTLLNGVR